MALQGGVWRARGSQRLSSRLAAGTVNCCLVWQAAKPKRADGSPDGLRALLAEAGAGDVMVHGPVTRTLRVADAEAYWERFARAAPGTRGLLAQLAPETAAALRAQVVSTLEARFGAGMPVELQASAYFATGRKLTPFQAAVVAGTKRGAAGADDSKDV